MNTVNKNKSNLTKELKLESIFQIAETNQPFIPKLLGATRSQTLLLWKQHFKFKKYFHGLANPRHSKCLLLYITMILGS